MKAPVAKLDEGDFAATDARFAPSYAAFLDATDGDTINAGHLLVIKHQRGHHVGHALGGGVAEFPAFEVLHALQWRIRQRDPDHVGEILHAAAHDANVHALARGSDCRRQHLGQAEAHHGLLGQVGRQVEAGQHIGVAGAAADGIALLRDRVPDGDVRDVDGHLLRDDPALLALGDADSDDVELDDDLEEEEFEDEDDLDTSQDDASARPKLLH